MERQDQFEYVEAEEVPLHGLSVYQQDKALIDRQIATAKMYPRNLANCISNAITLVTMDLETAEDCTYSLKKGKTITGPSVVLAKILAQELGNIRVENRVVGYDATHVTCEGTAFDLEKNYAIRTTIKRSIVGSNGRFSEDMCVIIGNAGNAIALRNAIFAIVPESVKRKVWDAAKKVVTGDLSDETKLVARRTALVNGLKQKYAEYKLTDTEIAKAVDKNHISDIDDKDVLVLIGFEKTLKAGEQSFEDIFRSSKAKPAPPSSKEKEEERLLKLIASAATEEKLKPLLKECDNQITRNAYDTKLKTFTKK